MPFHILCDKWVFLRLCTWKCVLKRDKIFFLAAPIMLATQWRWHLSLGSRWWGGAGEGNGFTLFALAGSAKLNHSEISNGSLRLAEMMARLSAPLFASGESDQEWGVWLVGGMRGWAKRSRGRRLLKNGGLGGWMWESRNLACFQMKVYLCIY